MQKNLSSKSKYQLTMKSNEGILSYENGSYENNVYVQQGERLHDTEVMQKGESCNTSSTIAGCKTDLCKFCVITDCVPLAGLNERGIDIPAAAAACGPQPGQR